MALAPVLPSFEWIDCGPDGGSFANSGPIVLVLHSTEGSSLAGAVGAYKSRGVPPHLTVSPRERRRAQHVRLDRSAYALRNRAGGVETNREGTVLQVEIVGFANESHNWSDDDLRFIADALRPIILAGELRSFPRFYGSGEGIVLARADAPQRMSFTEWRNFHGVCGHQHVPENDHWDPGKMNVGRMLELAWGAPVSPAPAKPAPKPAPKPSSPSGSLLRTGSKGDAVMRWQRRLNAEHGAGLLMDGDFGPRTHNATVAFQRSARIGADGIVGPKTRSAMEGWESRRVALLRRGNDGSKTILWQRRLNAYTGAGLATDGIFGPATERATKNFQSFFKLVADGIVGPKTEGVMALCVAVGR